MNIRQPQIFTVITSIGIIMIYIAYLLVTVPMLRKRLRGEWPPKTAEGQGYFTLGKFGLPINMLAVGWGIFMAVNLAWPRKDVYNATEPFHWYLQYGAILFIGIVFFGGLAYYWFVQRHKTGVLDSHRFESPSDAIAEPECREHTHVHRRRVARRRERRHRRGHEPGHGRVARPVAEGDREDARRAIAAANAAFPPGPRAPASSARRCCRVADVCERRADELARC